MTSKPLKIDELKKFFVNFIKEIDHDEWSKFYMEYAEKYKPVFKDPEISEKVANEGNMLYKQKDLDFTQLYKVVTLYNRSIAYAPKNSKELALAYANKSAVLLRMQKYKECVSEVEKVLKFTECPTTLKIKMLCRKAECLSALGRTDDECCLETAMSILTRFDGSAGEKDSLNKLIEKTQLAVEKKKYGEPKMEERKTQAIKMIEEAEKRGYSKSIRMEYSKEYRSHLVAARDYNPGEILFVEKPYFNSLAEWKIFQYCDHCFNHLWTASPCDFCSRRLYCSDKCRKEAWNEYHKTDCMPLCFMRVPLVLEWNGKVPRLLSIFCKALNQAGTIEKLLADSESSNDIEDYGDGVVSEAEFMNYKRFFTLPYIELNDAWLESYASDCLAVLLGLGMFTKVLGKTYAFKDYKKLMKDDKAMLVGALLLKFSVILHSSCLTANLIGPNDKEDLKKTKVEERDSTTTLIATLHASIGCIPNVEYCHAHGNKFITYAIQPIKAGDKLIANMKSKSIWDREKKSVRQKLYEAFYGSSCTCLACTEDWSDFDRGNYIDLHISDSTKPKIVKLWTEMDSILLGWKDISNETNFPDIKILNQTTDFVTKVCNEVSMPSAIVIRSVILLMLVLQAFHDPSEIHTEEKRISRKQEFKQVFDTSEMMKEMVKICNK